MTILAPDTIPIIADRLRLFDEVTLSAATAHEVLHRAGQSFRFQTVLEQIAQGNDKAAEWAKRVLADEKRDRPRLRFPDRLKHIEVA